MEDGVNVLELFNIYSIKPRLINVTWVTYEKENVTFEIETVTSKLQRVIFEMEPVSGIVFQPVFHSIGMEVVTSGMKKVTFEVKKVTIHL